MKKVKNGLINNLRYFCLLAAITLGLMAIVATGGGGGGGGGVQPLSGLTLADLVGTYNMSGFTVTFSDGTVITQDDVSTFSGTMVIESDGSLTQIIEINGFQVTADATILSVGNDTMRVSSAGCTYNLGIELSGDVLTTTAPMGTCGNDFSEVDVWIKSGGGGAAPPPAANIEASMNDDVNTVIDDDSDQAIPGGGIGHLYQILP
jgi:hypothetical protein